MSILVLALNPSVDVEWLVDRVRWEEKNSIQAERRWPGGKGVNVARWLQLLNAPHHLVLPLGGQTGEELSAGLQREGISFASIPLQKPTRANLIVTGDERGQLRFNPAGPSLSSDEWTQVLKTIRDQAARSRVVMLSGSLPAGAPPDAAAQVLNCGNFEEIKTVLDCDGLALASGLAARPFLVKPNVHELAGWAGKPLCTEKAVVDAAIQMSVETAGWVMVSRGADGALLLNAREQQCFQADSPKVTVTNTVGAGDAMLAGATWQITEGAKPWEWLRWGVACGAAAVSQPAGQHASLSFLRWLYSRTQVKVLEHGIVWAQLG